MKNKIILFATMTLSIFIFTGCAQPQFNPNDKGIVFVEGKAYAIPNNSKYLLSTLKKVDSYDRKGGCRKGDVQWVSRSFFKKMNTVKDEEIASIVTNSYKNHSIGCAHPLSNQEYQYRLNQQNQANSNARASAQINAQRKSDFSRSIRETNRKYINSSDSSSYYPTYNLNTPTFDTSPYGKKHDTYKVRQLGSSNLYKIKKL